MRFQRTTGMILLGTLLLGACGPEPRYLGEAQAEGHADDEGAPQEGEDNPSPPRGEPGEPLEGEPVLPEEPPVEVPEAPASFSHVCFEGASLADLSPDGETLFTQEEVFTARDTRTGQVRYQASRHFPFEVWFAHPDGQRFVVATSTVGGRDLFAWREVFEINLEGQERYLYNQARLVDWSLAGVKEASPHGFPVWRVSGDDASRVELLWVPWGVSTQNPALHIAQDIPWPQDTVLGPQAYISPDGQNVVIQGGAGDGRWRHWDLATGSGPHDLPLPAWSPRVQGLRFLEDARTFLHEDIAMAVSLDNANLSRLGEAPVRGERSRMLVSPQEDRVAWVDREAEQLMVSSLREPGDLASLGPIEEEFLLAFDQEGDLWFVRQGEEAQPSLYRWSRASGQVQRVRGGLADLRELLVAWDYNQRQGSFLAYRTQEQGRVQSVLRHRASQREVILPGETCEVAQGAQRGDGAWITTGDRRNPDCQVLSAVSAPGQVQASFSFEEAAGLRLLGVSSQGDYALVRTQEQGSSTWDLHLLDRNHRITQRLEEGGYLNIKRRDRALAYSFSPEEDRSAVKTCVIRW